MCRKSPAVAYYNRKIKTTSKADILRDLETAPITRTDMEMMICILEGLSYKQLSQIFNKSESRIYQWKRTLFENLHQYDMARLR